MIQISDKSQCCGCSACATVCPKGCIAMREDSEGFLYPVVDSARCIGCNLCQKVCPVLGQGRERKPLAVYAAKSRGEQVRNGSSSGGVFSLLAEKTIEEGGVVFGARFDENWDVVHGYTETEEGIAAFRGSKYVQSRIGRSFAEARRFLMAGRKVMFTGTPCQIAGLKDYLQKDYDGLLAVDVVCHGAPSPKVWRQYLNETAAGCGDGFRVKAVSFRDKAQGWKAYRFSMTLSKDRQGGEEAVATTLTLPSSENAYMNTFLSNLSLRPSCYACPAKAGKSCADITLGDFWGIGRVMPDFDDDRGCSVVLIYSPKGLQAFSGVPCDRRESAYSDALQENSCIGKSTWMQPNRSFFFHEIRGGKTITDAWRKCSSLQLPDRIRRLVFQKFKI